MTARSGAFVAHLPTPLRDKVVPTAALEDKLADVCRRARTGAAFDVPDDVFLAYVAERVPEHGEIGERLDALCAEDLYLACACALGDARAFARLRDETAHAIVSAAASVLDRDGADEVLQETLEKLLVGRRDKPPGITHYAGRGRLLKWAQTVALREAQSRVRRRGPIPVEDVGEMADRILGGEADAELEVMKRMYAQQFKAAFAHAFGTLTARERTLLRLEVIDGLSVERIAGVHGVHAATVFRWRAELRDALSLRTRRFLADELRLGGKEFQSVMRLIESQLDVSLPRLLREQPR